MINAIRNIVVHNAGIVDSEFLDKTARIPVAPKVILNKPFPIEGGACLQLIAATVQSSVELISGVDTWLACVDHPRTSSARYSPHGGLSNVASPPAHNHPMRPTCANIKSWLLADKNEMGYRGHMSEKEGGTAANLGEGWGPDSGSAGGSLEHLGNSPIASLSIMQCAVLPNELEVAGAPVPISALLTRIRRYANNERIEQQGRDACSHALEVMVVGQQFDFSDAAIYTGDPESPGLIDMLGGANNWAADGASVQILGTAEVDALVTLGRKTPCSDFETAFGAGVYVGWRRIAQALRGV